MDAEQLYKNMPHVNRVCPCCKKKKRDCNQVYFDEWHGEYNCRVCGLVF